MIPLAFHGHNKPVTCIQFNPDGDLLFTGGKDGLVNVWRTDDGERIGTYKGHRAVLDLCCNRTTTLLATAGMDFKTMLWRVETGEELATIEQDAIVRAVSFSHDDRLLFSVVDGMREMKPSIRLYNMPEWLGAETRSNKFNACVHYETPEKILYATWGPTNDHIYYGSEDGSVAILDVETQSELTYGMPHNGEVRKIHFDPTYRTIVSASKDKTAKLLDSRTLKTIATYTTDMPVNDADVSPIADHVVLAGGTDAVDVTTTNDPSGKFNARFYHKVHEDMLGQVHCHFGTIHRVAFHPSGKGFATGAEDGFAKIHMFDPSYYRSPGSIPAWHARTEEEDEDASQDAAE